MNENSPSASLRSSLVLQLLRSVAHLIAVATITIWGFFTWPLPWPGVLTGLGSLVLGVLIWALFLSPKPVLHTDRFGQSLIELLLIGGAVAAMFGLGVHPIIGIGFGVVAAVLGYIAGTGGTRSVRSPQS